MLSMRKVFGVWKKIVQHTFCFVFDSRFIDELRNCWADELKNTIMENDIKMKELDRAAEESLLDEVNHSCKNTTEVLARVGGFGRFQQILVVLTSIMTFPATYSILIMVFAGVKPDWKCSNNSTLCTGNTTYKSDNKTR